MIKEASSEFIKEASSEFIKELDERTLNEAADEFKRRLKDHNFNSICDFMDFKDFMDKVDPQVKHILLKEELAKEKQK